MLRNEASVMIPAVVRVYETLNHHPTIGMHPIAFCKNKISPYLETAQIHHSTNSLNPYFHNSIVFLCVRTLRPLWAMQLHTCD